MKASFRFNALSSRGFTIVELLAATAIFIGLMLLLVTTTNQTGDLWRRSSAKIEQFQQARRGFESMTRRISQATLNTYWDYSYPLKSDGKPDRTQYPTGYVRQSELRFRSGQASTLLGTSSGTLRPTQAIFFQAPLGFTEDESGDSGSSTTDSGSSTKSHRQLNNLLNTWGYYVEVGDDAKLVPTFLTTIIPPRVRSRLVELMEPSEYLHMDNPTTDSAGTFLDANYDSATYLDWFRIPVKKGSPVRVLSENILALVILPRLTQQDEMARAKANKRDLLCPVYDYDSKRLSNTAAGILKPNLPATDPELNPKNQLPPIVTVSMVAIDETSAQRLQQIAGSDLTFGLQIGSLFKDAQYLEDDPRSSEPGDGDLNQLEKRLINNHLTYRIFTSNIAIRGAKWSRFQDK